MCDLDLEYAEHSESVCRRARKDHRCSACGNTIPKGHKYHIEKLFLGHNGGIDMYKHCVRCSMMYELLRRTARPGDLIDLTLDCGEVWDGPEDSPFQLLAFLTPEDGQRVQEALEQAGGNWGVVIQLLSTYSLV